MKTFVAGVSMFLVMTSHAETLPDPTRPADYIPVSAVTPQVPEPPESANWKLTATRISPDTRTAIVNGHLVREGERIGEATVAKISPGSVMLNYRRQEIEVNLVPQNVKIVRGR